MRATSPSCRSDPSYGAALIAALLRAHPRMSRAALAAWLGLSRKHLRKIEYMRKELNLPLQLLIESKLDPSVVQDLRVMFKPQPPPYWVALIEGKHHGTRRQ